MKQEIDCLICNHGSKFCYKKNNYNFYKCSNCQLIFIWPTPDNLDKIYGQEYFKATGQQKLGYTNYDKDKEPMRQIFLYYLKKFESLTTDRKIFDIGTATGYFLDLAKKSGWQTFGIEISKYATDIAKARGHEVICSKTINDNIQDKFNVVTMWDVLEHLDNPKEYLKKVNNILESDGLLAINTVDVGSWWAKFFGKNWHQLNPPEHIFYYNKKNLKLLLEKNGFEIIETKKISKKFSIAYIFKILYNWQSLKIWRILENKFNNNFWRKFYIPINLRDNIFVLAKKIKELDF